MSNRTEVIVAGGLGYAVPYREALGEGLTFTGCYDPSDLADIDWDTVKAVVFTGGADIDPSFYGEEPDETTWCDSGHDAIDRAVLAELDAYEADGNLEIMKFGTCRGAQLLFTHYVGGKLVQDMPHHGCTDHVGYLCSFGNASGHTISHRDQPFYPPVQAPGSISINSIHHQAIDWNSQDARVYARRRPDGCYFVQDYRSRAPELLMVGESEGQTAVEAFTHVGLNVLGFQYHPEWLDTDTDGYRWSIAAIQHHANIPHGTTWRFPYNPNR